MEEKSIKYSKLGQRWLLFEASFSRTQLEWRAKNGKMSERCAGQFMSTWHKVQSFKKQKPHLKKNCSHNIALRARLWRISLIRDCCGRAQPIVKSDETKTDQPSEFLRPCAKEKCSSVFQTMTNFGVANAEYLKASFRCYRVLGPVRQHRLHFLKLVTGRRLEVEYETKSSSLLRKWGRISILLGGPSTGTGPVSHSSSWVWSRVPKRICNATHF